MPNNIEFICCQVINDSYFMLLKGMLDMKVILAYTRCDTCSLDDLDSFVNWLSEAH